LNDLTELAIFRTGQTGVITWFVKNHTTGDLIDLGSGSRFSMIDIDSNVEVLSENLGPLGGALVTRAAEGTYQFSVDTSVYPGSYIAGIYCVVPGETFNVNTFFKSVSAKQFAYAAQLRMTVDKANKSMVDYIANMDRPAGPPILLKYGYSDEALIYYMERGTQLINAVPPYTALIVDTFPFSIFGNILIDAATIATLEAQGIFAIDTDFDYAFGGNSMVIDHFTKLSAFVQNLLGRFKDEVSAFKKQYLTKGMVLYQFLPGGIRDLRYLSAMPDGFWSRLFSVSFG